MLIAMGGKNIAEQLLVWCLQAESFAWGIHQQMLQRPSCIGLDIMSLVIVSLHRIGSLCAVSNPSLQA
jgi:hypothetical protein